MGFDLSALRKIFILIFVLGTVVVCLTFIASLTKPFAYAFCLSCFSIFLACITLAIQCAFLNHIYVSTRRFQDSFGIDQQVGGGTGLTIGAFMLALGDSLVRFFFKFGNCNARPEGRGLIERCRRRRQNERQLRTGAYNPYPLPMYGGYTSNSHTSHQTGTTHAIESTTTLRSADAVHTHDSKPKRQVTLEREVHLERGYDCPICFEKSEVYQSLRCKHTFCSTCIKTALGARQLCPLCNGPATVEDLRPVNRVPTFASDKDTVEAPKDFSSTDAPLDTSRTSFSTSQ